MRHLVHFLAVLSASFLLCSYSCHGGAEDTGGSVAPPSIEGDAGAGGNPGDTGGNPPEVALPEAVGRLRAVRKQPATGELLALSAADPLNLVGILTPEARVPAIATNRVLLRDGVAIAALEGGELRRLAESHLGDDSLRTLFWRRSDTDLKIGSSTPSGKSHAALRQRLQHGSAGLAKRHPVGSH